MQSDYFKIGKNKIKFMSPYGDEIKIKKDILTNEGDMGIKFFTDNGDTKLLKITNETIGDVIEFLQHLKG